jgi:hypothetical protein
VPKGSNRNLLLLKFPSDLLAAPHRVSQHVGIRSFRHEAGPLANPHPEKGIQLANYTPDDTNPERLPTSANYVFARTAQVGGSFKFLQSVDLVCPEQTQTPHQIAMMQATHRWIVQTTSAAVFQGRSDAQATGGQIPSNQRFVGITCADLSQPDGTAERYWAMKLEQGNTVVRAESDSTGPASTTCNSAFGPVPSLTSTTNDYNFGAINFSDASIVPYPGQPSGFN